MKKLFTLLSILVCSIGFAQIQKIIVSMPFNVVVVEAGSPITVTTSTVGSTYVSSGTAELWDSNNKMEKSFGVINVSSIYPNYISIPEVVGQNYRVKVYDVSYPESVYW